MENILKNVQIFSNLTEKEYEFIKKIIKPKKIKKKEIIFNEGDKAHGFYIIAEGKVKIFKVSLEGKEQILHIFGPYQIFGEVPVFSGKIYPASAITIEDSFLFLIPKEDFIALIKKQPQIALNMLSILSLRLHIFTTVIENLSLKEVPSRLATYLLYLYEKNNKNREIDLDVSKNQLASILGTIPETLSRIFNKLTQQQIIEIDKKKITIINEDFLKNLSEGFEKL